MQAIQAPIGGELHKLSDKFYKGGQFMPDDNVFPASRRNAKKKAARLGQWRRPSISDYMGRSFFVYVETLDGSRRLVATCTTEAEQIAVRDELRREIEIRLGGQPLNWNE